MWLKILYIKYSLYYWATKRREWINIEKVTLFESLELIIRLDYYEKIKFILTIN